MFNLLKTRWIPVKHEDGSTSVVTPHEIADRSIIALNWDRLDLNIACHEFLIGLVYLSMPAKGTHQFEDGLRTTPEQFKKALEPFIPAFNLFGDGPKFMQDFEAIEGEERPVDALFIDSAGQQTIKDNKDVFVHRERYETLTFAEAAIALYALQSYAVAGGRGFRTSIRGGGPLTTLLDPQKTLWETIWINTPFGEPSNINVLPWMRPTVVSNGEDTVDGNKKNITAEVFFGMPRRIRLIHDKGSVTGFYHRANGNNYAGWRHPLTPYLDDKKKDVFAPVLAKPDSFSYKNALGVFVDNSFDENRTRIPSIPFDEFSRGLRGSWDKMSLLGAGWAVDKAKARQFFLGREYIYENTPEENEAVSKLVNSADIVSKNLMDALKVVVQGSRRDSEKERFYSETQEHFDNLREEIHDGYTGYGEDWLLVLREQATKQIDIITRDILPRSNIKKSVELAKKIRFLKGLLKGNGKKGKALYELLGIVNDVVHDEEKEGHMQAVEYTYHWWEDYIFPRETDPKAKALAAIIKREDSSKILLQPKVVMLRNYIGGRLTDNEFLFLVIILSNIRQDDRKSLPELLAKNGFSKSRFQSLQRANGSELTLYLRRAIMFADKKCNVKDMIESIFTWDSSERSNKWLVDFAKG